MPSIYEHDSKDYRLNDLHQAMQYRDTGEPEIRVNVGSEIVVSGDVVIPGAVEISNDQGNPIPVSFDQSTTIPVSFSSSQTDAFGRLRISNPYTLFDSFHRYQDNGKIGVKTVGTASSVHDSNSSSILMTVGTNNNDTVIRESTRVFAYQPGKSLLIFQTFAMNPPKTNLRQRIGYFDINNGIYLEQSNYDVYFVIRSSSANGTPQEKRIHRNNWDNPFLDLDLTRVQILFYDVEWLGVGSVRLGFVVNGKFVLCHTFNHANTEISTGVPLRTTYMGTACLPVRAEIQNIGSTDSSSVYRQICTSIISEGGIEIRGRSYSVGHTLSQERTISETNTLYPLISIRLKQGRDGAIVIPKNFSVGPLTQANYRYVIISGGTTVGGQWNSAGDNSSVEYNLTGTSIVGGSILEQSFIISSNQSVSTPSLEDYPFKYQLERNTLTSPTTYYEFIIAVETTTNDPKIVASLNWEEIT